MQRPKLISREAIKSRVLAGWAALRKHASREEERRRTIRMGARRPILLPLVAAIPLSFCLYALYVSQPLRVPDVLEARPPANTILRMMRDPGTLSVLFATPHWGGNFVDFGWNRPPAESNWGGGIVRYADGYPPESGGSWKLESGEANGHEYQILWDLGGTPPESVALRPGEYIRGVAFFPEWGVSVSYFGHREGRGQFLTVLNSIVFSERRQSSRDFYSQPIVLPGILELGPVPEAQLVVRSRANDLWVLFPTQKCKNNRMVFWKPGDTPELTAEKWGARKADTTADNVEHRTVNGADCEIVWKRTGASDSLRRIGGTAYLTAQAYFPAHGLRVRYSGDWEGKETFLKALDSLKILPGAEAKETSQ